MLTDQEKNIVMAAIRIWRVNYENGGHVPDYELMEASFGLDIEKMRKIRDIVQYRETPKLTSPY